MNLTSSAGQYGLVVDTDDRRNKRIGAGQYVSNSSAHAQECTGHFIILNRYKVDDDGHVCLTPSLPLLELYGSIDVFKAELESLLEQAKQRFPESIRAL